MHALTHAHTYNTYRSLQQLAASEAVTDCISCERVEYPPGLPLSLPRLGVTVFDAALLDRWLPFFDLLPAVGCWAVGCWAVAVG